MIVWIINNTNMLPEHGHLNRHYYFGKYLNQYGYDTTVFVGSHPHNTKLQLIEGKEKYKIYQVTPFPWVLIKTRNYEGSKKNRVISMFEFYHNMSIAAKKFEQPDVIIGSSTHPLAALSAIRLGKRYGCKAIVEIRDLWPESIVAYGVIKKNSIIAKLLYQFEKYLYTRANKIIFTMDGAYDYIIKKGWQKVVPKSKVFFLNNGIDLEVFDYNKTHYTIEDDDLQNNSIFKVVYTGSIRRVNDVGILLDVAKLVENPKIKFLIWGTGDKLNELKERVVNEKIDNVVFKGYAEKKYIPFILSKADLNLMHGAGGSVVQYGLSANKLFDYFAAGKPIICDFRCSYNPADAYNVGLNLDEYTSQKIADVIDKTALSDNKVLMTWGENARKAANDYDFKVLTRKLIEIINGE